MPTNIKNISSIDTGPATDSDYSSDDSSDSSFDEDNLEDVSASPDDSSDSSSDEDDLEEKAEGLKAIPPGSVVIDSKRSAINNEIVNGSEEIIATSSHTLVNLKPQSKRKSSEDRLGLFTLNKQLGNKAEALETLSEDEIGQCLTAAVKRLVFACRDHKTVGSTFNASLVYKNHIYTINLGDSCSFLVTYDKQKSNSAQCQPLNTVHNYTNEKEVARVKKEGGSFFYSKHLYSKNGYALMTLRSLGDKNAGDGHSDEPEGSVFAMEANTDYDLIVCTDGLTDGMNQINIQNLYNEKQYQINAETLVQTSFQVQHSFDDTSAIVVKASKLNQNNAVVAWVADGHGGAQTSDYILDHFRTELTNTFNKFIAAKKIISTLEVFTQEQGDKIPDQVKESIKNLSEKLIVETSDKISSGQDFSKISVGATKDRVEGTIKLLKKIYVDKNVSEKNKEAILKNYQAKVDNLSGWQICAVVVSAILSCLVVTPLFAPVVGYKTASFFSQKNKARACDEGVIAAIYQNKSVSNK